MRTLAALCIAALLGGCAAHVKTTVERDATTGQPRFTQDIKAPPGAIVELAGQNFIGSLKWNPETQTYDIDIQSGQDATGVQAENMNALGAGFFALMQQIVKTYGPPPTP